MSKEDSKLTRCLNAAMFYRDLKRLSPKKVACEAEGRSLISAKSFDETERKEDRKRASHAS